MIAHALELKRLTASGAEPTIDNMRGLTIARPFCVEHVTHVGKEIVVDPTGVPEDFTAELLGATEQTVYEDPTQKLDALRADVLARSISSVARAARVGRSTLVAFVHHRTKLRAKTQRAVVRALGRMQLVV